MMGRIWQSGETRRRSSIPMFEHFVGLTVGCFGDKGALYEVFDLVADWKRLPLVCKFLYFLGMIGICLLVRLSS